MKIKLLSLIALLFSAGVFTSCEKDAPEIETTKMLPMSGEWFVKYEVETAPGSGVFEDIYGAGYTKIMTSSTADNATDQMWIGDIFSDPKALNFSTGVSGEFWTYMVKANVDLPNMSFNADMKSIAVEAAKSPTPSKPAGVPATPYDIQVTITDGKVIKGGSTPPSGAVTDSIYFKLKFEDDPNTFRVSGYKRTGFLEDEH